MEPLKTNYRRNLPHIQPIGSLFFITFNLQGAIPKHILDSLQKEKYAKINYLKDSNHPNIYQEKINEHKRYFAKIDSILDGNNYGENILKIIMLLKF
jgi:putative transposase